MAGNAVIGSLRVNLGMDSAEFQNGAKRAQGTLAGLGASIKSFAAGAVAALSFGAVTAALKSSINHMDELGKAAQKIGIPVEQLSGLEYAARLADVSLGDLQGNLSKFNRALAEIAGGGKNDAGAALRAIGVSALDANGKLRPTSDLISDIAEKFAGYKDGAEKAALAQAIFGKSGADMIPLLNGGREAIARATEQAEKFGLIVDQQAAVAAERFNDTLTSLKGAGEGVANQVSTAMLPALVDVTNAMVAFAEDGTVAEQVAKALEFIMRESAKFLVEASAAWQEITTWVNAAGASFESLASGDISGAAEAWSKASTDVAAIWTETAERIKQIDGLIQHSNSALKGDLPGPGEHKKVAPTITLGKATGAGGAKETKPAAEIKEITKSLYDMDLGFAQVIETAGEANNAFGDTIKGQMRSWIDDAINGTFDLKDSLKGLLASFTDLALNNAFQAMFSGGHELYGGGGIGSIFGNLFGFAKGGTIMPGGTGGIDSQLVAFRKSPNERVDISKPGQSLTSGSGSNVQIIDQRVNAPPIDKEEVDGTIRFIVRDEIRQQVPGAVRRQLGNAGIGSPAIRRAGA
jgi:hypothetical protein